MRYERCLVTVTDVIAPTSMPFYEFVLYRRERYKNEKQIMILLFKNKIGENVTVPDDIEVHCVGTDFGLLRKVIRQIVTECSARDMDCVFHIHEAKSVAAFNLATHCRYKEKIVYTLHSTYKNYPARTKALCRLASAGCRAVVCVSNTSYRYYPEALKRRYHVFAIQNGVNTELAAAVRQAEEKRQDQVFRMAYVARLVPQKRHKMLFEIVGRIPGTRLSVIGNGPLMEELKAEAEAVGIAGRVEFMGLLSREDVYRELIHTDLYVSVSAYEGLPVSVLEAMACGVPCLVSDIEQHREIGEKCAAVTLADAVSDWVHEIGRFAAMTPAEREAIGTEGMRQVRQCFSLGSMHDHYNKVYGGRFA